MRARGVPDNRRRQPRAGGRPLVAGLRRVAWVRVTVLAGGARCEAIGMGHRIPVVRRIGVATAAELMAGGVPSLVRRRHDEGTTKRAPAPGPDAATAPDAAPAEDC